MSTFTEKLRDAFNEASLQIDEKSLPYFEVYKNTLMEWNNSVNLTAIRDEEGIIYRHFVDSLMLLKAVDIFSSLLDIGSGAGFPGLPLKIARQDIMLSLIESQRKKTMFLEILLEKLSFMDVKVYNVRAEELGKSELRESFDVVTERELGKFPINVEIGLPFVKLGGYLALYKGEKDLETIDLYKTLIEELSGSVEKIVPYKLNDGKTRYIILIKKEWHTPARYPRTYSAILKSLKKWEKV